MMGNNGPGFDASSLYGITLTHEEFLTYQRTKDAQRNPEARAKRIEEGMARIGQALHQGIITQTEFLALADEIEQLGVLILDRAMADRFARIRDQEEQQPAKQRLAQVKDEDTPTSKEGNEAWGR